MNDGIILGRSVSHGNSACILRNGRLVTAIETARLTHKKYDHENNDLAILYCLEAAGIRLSDVDLIVQNSPKHYFRAGLESELIADDDPRVWTISHHLAHGWSAFGTSPFERAVVVVIDGRGNYVPHDGDVILPPGRADDAMYQNDGRDWAIEVESIYLAEGRNLNLLYRNRNRGLPSSIGSVFSRRPGLYPGEYSGYYQYAGLGAMYEQASYGIFGSSLDGGKVMGLAAFAQPNAKQVAEIIRVDPSGEDYSLGTRWLHEIGGPAPVGKGFDRAAAIASDVQKALELGVEAVMRRARRLSGVGQLCYSGGVALNCCVNERLIRSGLFDEVFIQPACNDSGAAIGCAFFGHAQLLNGELHHERYTDFNGRRYVDLVDETLKRWHAAVVGKLLDDPVEVACELLCSGKIVGWYRGGSELGPRALGHRSILALPHPRSIKERLNNAIKRRESFRPYAPVVPVEYASRYFHIKGESPYMLRVVEVRPEYRNALAAVTHVDGTARVQTVRVEDAPVLHRLLRRVGHVLGIPILLNTSFNTSGFPMVETPDDAISCLLSSGMDCLFLEDWLLERRYSTSTSVRAPTNPGRWRLVPGVEITHRYTAAGEEAWLQLGPRKRRINCEDAEFLCRLDSIPTASEQEATHPNPESGRKLLDSLFADGWVYGTAISTNLRRLDNG